MHWRPYARYTAVSVSVLCLSKTNIKHWILISGGKFLHWAPHTHWLLGRATEYLISWQGDHLTRAFVLLVKFKPILHLASSGPLTQEKYHLVTPSWDSNSFTFPGKVLLNSYLLKVSQYIVRPYVHNRVQCKVVSMRHSSTYKILNTSPWKLDNERWQVFHPWPLW